MDYEQKSVKGAFDTAGEGSISASIATFNVVDSDHDVCLPTFFKQGQRLPMVWAHDWTKPIGIGTVDVQRDQAVFNGQLMLDTFDGSEAYKKMKAFGTEMQEFSFGYVATDSERGVKDGKQVRFLKQGEVYEASPVLVGANRATRLLSIKAHKGIYVDEPPENSYESLSEDIAEAMTAQGFAPDDAVVMVLATYSNYAYVSVDPDGMSLMHDDPDDGDTTYWRVEYTLDESGDPVLANPTEVEPGVVFNPTDEPGISFAGQSQKALAAVERLASRTSALVALRQSERKSGRVLSAANHAKLTAVHNGIAGHLAAMAGVLKAHAPDAEPAKPAGDAAKKMLDRRRLLNQYLQNEARLNGVAV